MFSITDVAQSNSFDTAHWRSILDVTLTLKQARKSDKVIWVWINVHECQRAFARFMNLLNRAIYKNAFPCLRKRIRVLPVLEKDLEGRWHYHCAIEPPAHADNTVMDTATFERLVDHCWSKVHWAHRRILIRDNVDRGWIQYMLKERQKSGLEAWADSIDWEALHNPIANA